MASRVFLSEAGRCTRETGRKESGEQKNVSVERSKIVKLGDLHHEENNLHLSFDTNGCIAGGEAGPGEEIPACAPNPGQSDGAVQGTT